MSIQEISVDELEAALAAGGADVRVIDVRETDEYVGGHVPGAVHVALGTVPDHVDRFTGPGTTYVICKSGARSMRACEFLAQQGVEAVNVAGGTMAWKLGGRSVVDGDQPRAVTHRWVATDDEFAGIVDTLIAQPRYAIDTEFHRERTYYPKLALVQLVWDDQIVLVDPLAIDTAALRRLFASPAIAVFHAAQQDLDVLTQTCGAVPDRLFDTQLAAGFTGYSTPSLLSLLQSELGIVASKGDRLTDWLRRPLTADQQTYVAGDVAHLLQLHDLLTAELVQLGRLSWALDACEELRTRPTGAIDPEQAWLRLKDVRVLKARSCGVAQSVTAWRERRAAAVDVPVRQILPDLAILGIAQKHPSTAGELAQARGVEERHARGALGTEILAAVADGLKREVPTPVPDGEDLERALRPAVTLVSAWVSEVAKVERIDTALLATRADLVALLRGDADARLAHGWRGELLGDGIRRLVEGRAGLTFDGRGGLRLIDIAPAT